MRYDGNKPNHMENIVLNIPHSSIAGIFDKEIGGWPRNAFFVNGPIKNHTDWYTDMLFSAPSMEKVISVVFNYSRFVCDVERLDNDPLEEIGQGIIYTNYGGFTRSVNDGMKKRLLQIRKDYLSKLSDKILDNGRTLLIDCHSFNNTDCGQPDICIGFNDDFSYSENVVNILLEEFKKSGYTVAINSPYSNSITPTTLKDYRSVMIEVNKRVYMDESLFILNNSSLQWTRWYGCLERIYHNLLAI